MKKKKRPGYQPKWIAYFHKFMSDAGIDTSYMDDEEAINYAAVMFTPHLDCWCPRGVEVKKDYHTLMFTRQLLMSVDPDESEIDPEVICIPKIKDDYFASIFT